MSKMNNSGWIRWAVKGMMISGLICVIASSNGCSSLPWTKKKDNIYSPKPAYQRMDKDAKENKGELSRSVGGFLSSDRPMWDGDALW